MGRLLGFIFRSPHRAAIVCGILVAVVFGLASFPQPEVTRPVTDWRIESASLPEDEQQRLLSERAAGDGGLVELSEDEFRARGFPYSVSQLDVEGSRRFVIQHTGADDLAGGPVYLAEREVFAAPWWSPHRFIYKAARAEVDAFEEVLHLTYERDVLGLTGLVILDAMVGAIYGLVVGLLVSVLRGTGLTPTQRRGDSIRHHPMVRTRSSI